MPQLRKTVRVSVDTRVYTQDRVEEHDGDILKDPVLNAAKTGVLTTRTSNSVGTLTMDPGHGIVTADRLDLFWADPLLADGVGQRYGCVVGTVAGNSVPLTGGAGDNLPLAATPITAAVPQLETFPVTAANLEDLLAKTDGGAPGWAVFYQADGTTLVAAARITPVTHYIWTASSGLATPFGADVAKVYLSHGDATAARRVTAQALVS
jgi:hypothetical protein